MRISMSNHGCRNIKAWLWRVLNTFISHFDQSQRDLLLSMFRIGMFILFSITCYKLIAKWCRCRLVEKRFSFLARFFICMQGIVSWLVPLLALFYSERIHEINSSPWICKNVWGQHFHHGYCSIIRSPVCEVSTVNIYVYFISWEAEQSVLLQS